MFCFIDLFALEKNPLEKRILLFFTDNNCLVIKTRFVANCCFIAKAFQVFNV